MPEEQPYDVAVVVPTLEAGEALRRCLDSLSRQTHGSFQVIVVDNSGSDLAREICYGRAGLTYLTNERNLGFGGAVNRGFRESSSPFLAALNDDAEADAAWLSGLVAVMQSDLEVGMCASQVLLEDGTVDSAGMLMAMDGSSKQRGHGHGAKDFGEPCDVLFPSGAAALYRRDMLEQTGLFDESFFLYCEDSDLGLRGRWAGWRCRYVPGAKVTHSYSKTAGRASPQKAYLVERNRLRLVAKNFPIRAALADLVLRGRALLLACRAWVAGPWQGCRVWEVRK